MKILSAGILMFLAASAHAFPVPPFYAEVQTHSSLFEKPLLARTVAEQSLDGHTFIQTARIKTDCGSDVISTVETQIQANAMTGGHTGFVRIRIRHTPEGERNRCHRQLLSEILPISTRRELKKGNQYFLFNHPLHPDTDYLVKVAYQPIEPDKVHIMKTALESGIPKD